METGALVKEHLFTTQKGEAIERYGVIVSTATNFDGYVEVVWQPRPGHPVATEAHQELAAVSKLEVVVPSTINNVTR